MPPNMRDFTITYTGQDGYEAGYLEEVTVDSNGVLNGSFPWTKQTSGSVDDCYF